MGFFACVYAVNRRVGGLEKKWLEAQQYANVNRRVGGLEIIGKAKRIALAVNRRVGGLEISFVSR